MTGSVGTPGVSSRELILPEALRGTIVRAIGRLPPEPTRLVDVSGQVLAEPLVAPFDLPRFANAAMDGYAVRSEDLMREETVSLRRVGTSLAGHPFAGSVTPGTAASIATGAMLPQGADAVVPIEYVTVDGDHVVVAGPIEAGSEVRSVGEDVRAGDVVVEAGAVMGPGQVAAAAALGMASVLAFRRPVVAVLPTGDEVRPPGQPLDPGQVHDAASAALSALISEAGAIPLARAVAPDDVAALGRAIDAAAGEADAIVTVGGASMGERDCLRALAEEAGRQDAPSPLTPFQVALRPARPFAFGLVHGVPLFGLPGNPASALAAFEELVRPALMAMLGRPPSVRPSARATLAEPLAQKPGRLHLIRAEVWRDDRGKLWARPAGRQGAGMIHSLARAQAWAVVPPDVSELPRGSEVDVRLLVEVP